jgi:hypothetical protein
LTKVVNPSLFLGQCDQVVIYGAGGWMGHSALDFITALAPEEAREKVLLIGSKHSEIKSNKITFEVFDQLEGYSAIRENAIFFNSAFLRREFLQKMTSAEYVRKNEEIASLARRAINQKKLHSFINLSSGAARDLDQGNNAGLKDEYSNLKKSLEVGYKQFCGESNTTIVNCRIFSLSGRYLNEFENLALSSFIRQVIEDNRVQVKSPLTKRTYVDAVNLAGILLSASSLREDLSFDSGGTLVTMYELAQIVVAAFGASSCEVFEGIEVSPDYFGEYEEFNALASDLGLNLIGIHEQVLETLHAFNREKKTSKFD